MRNEWKLNFEKKRGKKQQKNIEKRKMEKISI